MPGTRKWNRRVHKASEYTKTHGVLSPEGPLGGGGSSRESIFAPHPPEAVENGPGHTSCQAAPGTGVFLQDDPRKGSLVFGGISQRVILLNNNLRSTNLLEERHRRGYI